jgi:hypothetical protein
MRVKVEVIYSMATSREHCFGRRVAMDLPAARCA